MGFDSSHIERTAFATDFATAELAQFLRFVTAQDSLPVPVEPRYIQVSRSNRVRAQTCFRRLELIEFASKVKLLAVLREALANPNDMSLL